MFRLNARLFAIAFIFVFIAGCASPVAGTPNATTPISPSSTPEASTLVPQENVILVTGDWPPYVFENEADHGPIVAIVEAAFQEAGIQTKIYYYPWKRAEDEVRQGNAFAAFPYAKTEERLKAFDFSDTMYMINGKFFYNKNYHPNGITYNEIEDLRGYKIGGMLGSWYETYFKEAGLDVEYVNTIEQNVEKLARGRIDLTIEEENSVWYLIRKLHPNDFADFATLEKSLVQPGSVNSLNLMVSRQYPNSPELLNKFNEGLSRIRANGTFKAILEKYKLAIQP